ncbi:PREDICTED: homocysteine-responsive endoplasmic reticulum-resident ubiquitin-like domain member 2 protein [Branchiostoma belcheri]|uniref:Homocysteine-responsive endoplasmic reticulum-resident ubiquitin-like domain member 2 protein n=1 Tax=Branchiostoma belcheri TaxID=7741 RepID=A0A6P5AEX9_BRABE|nr:PREDICTED: homocysteine-responsive endoplasmic reticulum-resident ubiquitin-like domain member 2 protein [Branchiostoma belcheri]
MGCSPSRGYVRDGSGSERERARRIFRRPKVSIRVGPAVKPLQGDEPRIVFIFGGPGSRKGIIIDRLIQMYGFILLSAEDLILHQLPKRVSHAIDVRNTQGMSSLLREDPSHLTLDWVLKLMGDRIFADSEKHFLIDMVPNLKFLLKVKSFMKDCTAEMEEFEEHHPCAFALNLAIPEDRVLKQVEEALCKKKQAENMPEVDQQQTDEMDTSRTRRRHELYQSSVKAFLDYFHQTERVVTVDVSCGIPDLIWGRVQSFFGELDFKPRRPVKTVVLFVLEEEDLKGIELAKYGIVKVNLNALSGDDGCYGSDKLLKALHDYMQALSHDTENFAVVSQDSSDLKVASVNEKTTARSQKTDHDMELEGLDASVTLVIKAPNQRYHDQTVECVLGWTVKKLKSHLAEVYPSKPTEQQQRLIYSGKLLEDHHLLKDVLRQYEETSTHTVHLVCAPTSAESASYEQISRTLPTEMVPPSVAPGSVSQTSAPDAGGLRHRGAPATPASPYHSHQAYYMYSMMQQYGAGAQVPMTTTAGYPINPQQAYWMQMYGQYAQHMAYMQLAQQYGGLPTTTAAPMAAAQVQQPVAVANQNIVPNQPANQRPENVRMNAQGGMVMDDDDDEEGNRDWLDWLYTLSRAAVLLSIVYFYSTTSRFVLLLVGLTLVYLFQAGWFRVRRRQPPREPVVEAPARNEARAENQDQAEDENGEGSGTEDETDTPAEPPPIQQPGMLLTAWTFLSTFFTSLIPQQPPPVNLN